MGEPATFQRDFFAALTGKRAAERWSAPGIAVHRNTGARALQAALADNYPVVRRLFGDVAFDTCAAAFASARPPSDPRLSHYGQSFAAFLRDYAPAAEHFWIADIAALERLWLEALFAADAVAADPAILVDGIDTGMTLALHPATRFAQFDTPAATIWLAHDTDDVSLESLDWRSEAVLVTRPCSDVRVAAIDYGGLVFLTDVAVGQPLLAAAETALAAAPSTDLSAMFAQLLAAGAFLSPRSHR